MSQRTGESEKDEILQVRCDPSFKQKLRVEAAKTGKQMSEYVRDTLRTQWSTGRLPNKDPDTSTCTPEPSIDSDSPDNGKKSDTNGESEGALNSDSSQEATHSEGGSE